VLPKVRHLSKSEVSRSEGLPSENGPLRGKSLTCGFATLRRATAFMSRLAPLVIYLLAMSWAARALAQAPAPTTSAASRAGLTPRPITAIDIRGNQRLATPTIREVIKTQVGDTFSAQAVDADVRAVRDLGFFLDVVAKVEDYARGYRLIFEVVERPTLAEVRFAGNKRFSDSQLQKATELRPGRPLDFYLLGVAEDRIRDLYFERGYQFAQIAKEVTQTDNQYVVSFHIVEGPPVHVKAIRIEGNAAFPDRKLLGVCQTKPYRFILAKGLYDPATLETDLLRIVQFYSQAGYMDVVVDRELSYSEDKTELTITITVQEGPRYQVAEVILSGNQAVSGREIREQLVLREGDPFSQEGQEQNFRRIAEVYGSRGYLLAENLQVTPRITYAEEPGQLALEYRFQEGAPLYIDEVRIVGNYKTRDKVVRRDLTFYPGELLDSAALRRSVERLRGRGHYETVSLELQPGSTPDSRSVVVALEEARTAFFRFGAGFSSNSGFIGDIAFVQRNFDWTRLPRSPEEFLEGTAFAGAGQYLRIQFQPGTEVTMFRVDFTEPWLFDRPYSLGLSGYLFSRRREDYDEDRRGGSVSLGHRFTPEFSVRGTVKVETVELRNVNPTTTPDILALAGTSDIHSLRLDASYDRRDNWWQPSRGYRLTTYFEHFGQFLGGDWNLWKAGVDGQYFRTLHVDRFDRKHILALTSEANFANTYAGGSVPIFERYFAGGAYSVRGFEYRGIGRHFGNQPLGGEARLLAGAEYSFPLVAETIRGILFWDAGQVARTASELNLGDFRSAVGFGLRLSAPGLGPLPIALDFGFPLNAQDGDEKETFSFSIGAFF